jgi:hypothetical protein
MKERFGRILKINLVHHTAIVDGVGLGYVLDRCCVLIDKEVEDAVNNSFLVTRPKTTTTTTRL